MRYSIIIFFIFLNNIICFSQIKGTTVFPYSKIKYENLREKPTENDLLLDSLLSRSKQNFYYDEVKFVKDTLRLKYQIDTLNGKFNGKCKIWDLNDVLLVSGRLKNNQKIGKWIFNYPDNSKNQIVRKYKSSYQFNQLNPERKNTQFQYPVSKSDSLNYIIYPIVSDNEVFYSKISWRFIPKNKNNKHLFDNNRLWNGLKKGIADNIVAYSDSYFSETIDNSELIKKIENNNFEVVGYKIRDMFYCNSTYSISEIRILSICPVIKTNDKLKELLWFYYPEIRSSISKIPYNLNDRVSTIEDVFHYRYFDSFIYETEGTYGEKPETMNIFENEAVANYTKFSITQKIYQLIMEYEFFEVK